MPSTSEATDTSNAGTSFSTVKASRDNSNNTDNAPSQPAEKKRRLENTTICCPVVFGSIAFWMGKKAEEHATHRWTLYVRGPNDEDLSAFVSRIIFSLHPSFAAPLREITAPPFEVTEMGWGEFEAGIRIFFKDPEEKPVDILHMIKLYPEGGQQQQLNVKKPVVMEYYDEIVFTNPTTDFRANLMQYHPPVPRPITWLTEYYTVFNEETDLQKLMAVQDFLAHQIDAAKLKLVRQESELGFIQHAPPAPSNVPLAPQSHPQQTAPPAPLPLASALVQPTATASSTAATAKKKRKPTRDKAERERVEKEEAEKEEAAAMKKRAANAKAKKNRAEKVLKDKAKAAALAIANTTSSSSTSPNAATTTSSS